VAFSVGSALTAFPPLEGARASKSTDLPVVFPFFFFMRRESFCLVTGPNDQFILIELSDCRAEPFPGRCNLVSIVYEGL